MADAIEQKLAEAGYSMLGDDKRIEKLILNILKTENIRYLKAIPFLIYKHKADIGRISENCVGTKYEVLFHAIIAITSKLFNEFNLPGLIMPHIDSDAIQKAGLNYNEFMGEFELQLRQEIRPALFIEKQKIYAERDLQMYLSQLFTKKEKQIIRRLLGEKPISRTDYEYYSRKTKKKLKSIIGLQDFARTLYTKSPTYDEDLFSLKKMLESWLEKGSEGILILKFFLWGSDKLSISYRKKNGADQIFNTNLNLGDIKDKELLRLLKKYKQHEFS